MMAEIKVSRDTMMSHASNMSESVAGISYFPMQHGSITYTRSQAISNYREALFELVNSVESFEEIVHEDALRIKQVGEAYAANDRKVAGQLEVR